MDGASAPTLSILFFGTEVMREYLEVATCTVADNGLGMGTACALENIVRFRRRASIIAETIQAVELFLSWAARFEVCGKRLHDLQLLASATVAGMDGLLTANQQDFPETGGIGILPLADLKR